jgi:hypothetical protein
MSKLIAVLLKAPAVLQRMEQKVMQHGEKHRSRKDRNQMTTTAMIMMSHQIRQRKKELRNRYNRTTFLACVSILQKRPYPLEALLQIRNEKNFTRKATSF